MKYLISIISWFVNLAASHSFENVEFEVLWSRSAKSTSWIETIDRYGRTKYHPVYFKKAASIAAKIYAIRTLELKEGLRLRAAVIDNTPIAI